VVDKRARHRILLIEQKTQHLLAVRLLWPLVQALQVLHLNGNASQGPIGVQIVPLVQIILAVHHLEFKLAHVVALRLQFGVALEQLGNNCEWWRRA